MEINELHKTFLTSSGISTDTRSISVNSIFFALKGNNFNGNSFAGNALEKGASFAVIDEQPAEDSHRFILVDNVLVTLQKLAAFHREYLNIPIIGLTGSNGKTTTKELINVVLSKKYRTCATKGNLNNHIGVPLTLLSMTKNTEIGIVEMGANHQKEIMALSEIAQPDHGFITNFGKAHLEGFGGVEGVIAGKRELYDFLMAQGKMLFLNYDDPIQKEQAFYKNKFTFGVDPDADLHVQYHSDSGFARITADDTEINSSLIGHYNTRNLAAAFAVGTFFDVPTETIRQALETYTPSNNRSQVIERGTNKIIMDAYNANPTSMAAALENFETREETPKIAVLGDMFELGAVSDEEHQQLVEKLEDSLIDKVYLIGDNFHRTTSRGAIHSFRTFDEFKVAFLQEDIRNTLFLIKGSRGMALERVLDLL